MSAKSSDPFSLDAAIKNRLLKLPEPTGEGYKIEDVLGAPKEPVPEFWRLSSEKVANLQLTAIDRSLPARELTESLRDSADLTITGRHKIQTSIGPVTFSGSALLCTCPDCQAPMTIRLWLGLADCWQCAASIELDERVMTQLAMEVQRRKNERTLPPPPPRDFFGHDRLATVDPPVQLEPPEPPRVADVGSPHEFADLTQESSLANVLRRVFRITPAWLVSFLLHLIAILILAVIVFGDPASKFAESITLSTFIDASDTEGGDIRLENPIDTLQDDVALAARMEDGNEEIRDAVVEAAADAMELRSDVDHAMRSPDLETVRKNIMTRSGSNMSFAARDPRVRAEIVKKEGGTNLTEAAVARGLRWLASVQNEDGSWSLSKYNRSDRSKNKGDTMGTALALLPFLGAGQTHEYGVYKKTVAGGLKWLLETQKADGDLRGDTTSQAGMYAHGQAAIVLCEALALSGDRQFFDPVQRAIRFIEYAQHDQGGWRYRPKQAGDTSIFGWQMMALQSAQAAGMNVQINPQVLVRADAYLDSVASQPRGRQRLLKGATYGYQPRREATEVMTAEAILCRMYLGWRKDDPRLKAAVDWLIENYLPSSDDKNLYYWYYGTQVMHHYGGDPWEKWNRRVRTLLIRNQASRGRYPGSWPPSGFEWGQKGGRIYTTSMAVCTLEVYYRHLPLFKQLELE